MANWILRLENYEKFLGHRVLQMEPYFVKTYNLDIFLKGKKKYLIIAVPSKKEILN